MLERILKLAKMQIANILKKDDNNTSTTTWIVMHLYKMSAFVGVYFFLFYVSSKILVIEMDENLLASLLLFIGLFLLISTITDLSQKLYLDDDNAILFSLPVKPIECFLSKLVVEYVWELIKTTLFILPLFILFGIMSSASVSFYIFSILAVLIIPLLIILISAILSVPYMYIRSFLNMHIAFRLALIFILFGFLFVIVVGILKNIPSDIKLIAMYDQIYPHIVNFLSVSKSYSLFFGTITNILFGYQILFNILIILLIIAICSLLVYFVCRPIYFKLASGFNSTQKVEYKSKSIHTKNTFAIYFKKELKSFSRDSRRVVKAFVHLLFMPIVILSIISLMNAFDTSLFGDKLVLVSVFLIICIITLTNNTESANIVSGEKEMYYLDRIVPNKAFMHLSAKLLVNVIISIVSITISTILTLFVVESIDTIVLISICLIIAVINIAHIFMSGETDLIDPQVNKKTSDDDDDHTNMNKSIVSGLVLSILFTILFASKLFGLGGINSAIVFLLIIAIILCVVRIVLFIAKLRVYFNYLQK